MLTTKQLRAPNLSRPWIAPNPKYLVFAIAITSLVIVLFPRVNAFISHQIQLDAAGGRSCLRVNADRTDQVRKYGSDCDL